MSEQVVPFKLERLGLSSASTVQLPINAAIETHHRCKKVVGTYKEIVTQRESIIREVYEREGHPLPVKTRKDGRESDDAIMRLNGLRSQIEKAVNGADAVTRKALMAEIDKWK